IDNYLAITGTSHPFLSGAETFHTPSLGDEEFEIPPIPLDSDPSLAVVGHFEDLPDPGGSSTWSVSAKIGGFNSKMAFFTSKMGFFTQKRDFLI
uniref:Uncharacterized protein n=1 Tax=Taeniopygia guttata TaxID=59729 RepID=A0A674H833_TAEGU